MEALAESLASAEKAYQQAVSQSQISKIQEVVHGHKVFADYRGCFVEVELISTGPHGYGLVVKNVKTGNIFRIQFTHLMYKDRTRVIHQSSSEV